MRDECQFVFKLRAWNVIPHMSCQLYCGGTMDVLLEAKLVVTSCWCDCM